jgi:hypothetical protein
VVDGTHKTLGPLVGFQEISGQGVAWTLLPNGLIVRVVETGITDPGFSTVWADATCSGATYFTDPGAAGRVMSDGRVFISNTDPPVTRTVFRLVGPAPQVCESQGVMLTRPAVLLGVFVPPFAIH